MAMKFSQLQRKEVICLSDGRRLGFVEDMDVEIPEGHIHALFIPGPCRLLGLFGRKEDYCIPWHCIRKIGPDIILVDTRPEDCRVPRLKKRLF